MPPDPQDRRQKTAYEIVRVMRDAFQTPSSFTMVMVPDACPAAVLSAAFSRAAEKSYQFSAPARFFRVRSAGTS